MSWIRKRKKYKRPRKLYDKKRIEEENDLLKKYGLKNKKEIWKAEAKISRIRNQAKKLITAGIEEQKKFFEKLNKLGFKVNKTADVLALNKEDWLKRRLQSIIIEGKKIKPKQARQLIVHRHVTINEKIVNVPSYVVEVDEESKIGIRARKENKKINPIIKEEVEEIKND